MLPPALNSRSTATVDTGTDNTCLASMPRHGNMCSFRFHHPSTSKSTSSSSCLEKPSEELNGGWIHV
ncbi:unnamed protein product [Cuscuta campestris]|uniref:Uncharacterized protein n=1 Tax=Cuscuta campestris TaxID=132261 RepID=A0A484KLI5_9ASTE|nr:unnamed protein product [Cuscuta campestris]